jgi:outer membrane protein TolC
MDMARLAPKQEQILAKSAQQTPEKHAATLAGLAKYGDYLNDVVPVVSAAFADNLKAGVSNFSLGNIRDQVTSQIDLTLAQPLTPLLQIHKGYQALKHMEKAQELDHQSKQAEVAYQISETYFKLLQTMQLTEVAQTGVEQVSAHLKRAEHFYVAGLIGKQDVLKAKLELARAQERVIKARYGTSLVTSALALHMGLSPDAEIEPTEKVTDPPAPFAPSLEECIQRATKQRPELKSVAQKQEAAQAGKQRALWDMIPSISAVASYQHQEGMGALSPKNAFFVGGILEWDIWDWGKKYYGMRAEQQKVQQAQLGERMLRDGVHIQAKKAFLELEQAKEALNVARAAIVEAEENFRIEQRRFDANANTSTDVLDAQLALTRAKLTNTTSLYDYYIARAALLRAMGEW